MISKIMRTINLKSALSVPNSAKTKSGANGKFLPKPLLFHLRHPNSKTNQSKFWQTLSPKNSLAKTSSTELALEFRQFLLWRNPTSPATTIPKKENWNRAKPKKNVWWRGEGGAEQQKRRQTVVSDSLVERRLCRDGIRRGAYDYISHHHALRVRGGSKQNRTLHDEVLAKLFFGVWGGFYIYSAFCLGEIWGALRASRISVSKKSMSSVLVSLLYQARTYFQNK